MKRQFLTYCLAIVGLCGGLVTALPSASAHEVTYFTTMSGPAEFPANNSTGIGTATVTIDLDTLQMRVQASFSGLTGNTTNAHIHCCVSPSAAIPTVGVATPTPTFPGFPSGVTAGTYDQTFNLGLTSSYNAQFMNNNGGTASGAMQALLAGLDSGQAYFNIHSSSFGGGEIRGFLQPVPEPASGAVLLLGGFALTALRRRRGC